MAFLPLLSLATSALAQAPTDEHIAGYATAVLEREFHVPSALVRVESGVLWVDGANLDAATRARARQVLGHIPGVLRVEIAEGPPLGTSPGSARSVAETPGISWLSRTPLVFEPLHADPRWPHFSASYELYRGNDDLGRVGAARFGESFSLYRNSTKKEQWDIGLQAGVFAIFDLDAKSADLVNADYFFGPAFAWRRGAWSALGRVYHQSSHLGDEYLLRTGAPRLNISYEVLDALVSWDATDALRLYAGGGWLMHTDTPLERWIVEAGAELFGPALSGAVRPLVALDVQSRQQNDWSRDTSVRAGIQIEDPGAKGMRMQVLLEYYRGRSPNGQFFEHDIEFYGLGVHFYF